MKKLIPACLMLILAFLLAVFGLGQQGNAASAPKYFAYVANSESNNISAYSINPATGALSEIKGSPFLAGNSPCSMTTHPNGKFLYVANYQSHSISAYSINPISGALTAIKGISFTKETPFLLTMAPSGKFLYVVNVDRNVSIYAVNPKTGELTAIKGSPFHIQKSINSITIDSSGKLAFLSDYERNSIIVYSINTATGKLTKLSETTITTGTGPKSISIDPTGKFAFIPNYDSQNFSVYTINAKTGKLTEIKGSPFGADHPTQVTFALSGKVVYILNCETIDAYSFDPATSTLIEFKNNPLYHSMDDPSSFSIVPTKEFLYVTNADSNEIAAFSINNTTGSLNKIKGSPFKTGNGPVSIVTIKQ